VYLTHYLSSDTNKGRIFNLPKAWSYAILEVMSAHPNTTPLCRPGTLRLVLLSLFSAVCANQVFAQTPAAKPAPDVIVFTNGDQLTGTLERGVGDSVVFKSDIVGEITVSMDKVKELHSNGKFTVLKKSEKITRTSNPPATITYADNAVTVANPSGTPEVVPVKDLAYIIDQATYNKEVTDNPGFLTGWKGAITGGATVIRSTQDGTNLNAGIALIRAIPTVPFLPARTKTTFDLLETYGKLTEPTIPQTTPPTPTAEAKTNIFHADAEHDKYLSARFYALVGAAFDHNFSQGLNFQQIYGVGAGWTAIMSPKQELDLKADVHYERQNFQPPNASLDLIGSTFAENYHRNLPAKIVFTETGSYIQSWNDFHAYSAIGGAGLELPVYKRFGLNINVLDNFINNPAFGYEKNSFQFVTGVTYTLP
jgi:hypothetical protein